MLRAYATLGAHGVLTTDCQGRGLFLCYHRDMLAASTKMLRQRVAECRLLHKVQVLVLLAQLWNFHAAMLRSDEGVPPFLGLSLGCKAVF